jgi:Transposase domain (DUF772)
MAVDQRECGQGVGWLWSNDTVVAVSEIPLLRVTTPPLATWDALLPDQATRLPTELATIDAYLDDERFLAPWRAHFHARLGRPSVPIPTLLRLVYLKHRYQLGYETLCKEVGDSISWRRFAASSWTSPSRTCGCRIFRSPHATCAYSWRSPPSRSRRTTLPAGSMTGSSPDLSGGSCPKARCGRCML